MPRVIELRVVGSTDDQSFLLLSDTARGKRGRFVVPIDRELLAILQAAVYARRDGNRREVLEEAPGDSSPTSLPAPKVPPREIQRLLRAGMSVERVADVLDCDEDLVERFLTPILYERSGVIKDIQRLSIEKSRLGASGLPIFDAIESNLATRRIRLTEDRYFESWDATREEGQPWKLTFTFDFRGRQIARFEYDPRTGDLDATNKIALDIAWVPEGTEKPNNPPPMPAGTRSKRKPASGRSATRKPAAKKPASKRKPATRSAAPKRAAAAKRKPAVRKPAPKRAAAAKRKPVTRKPAPARAKAKRKPATTTRKPVARKTVPKRAAATKRKPAARRAPARSTRRR